MINHELSSVAFTGQMFFLHKALKISIHKMTLKIMLLKLLPHLPGYNELMLYPVLLMSLMVYMMAWWDTIFKTNDE